MKQLKFTALIVVASLISSSASAIPFKHWGVKVGYTAAEQNWEHDWISNDDISMRPGFHVGVLSDWFDYKGLSLNVGIQYEQKGMNETINLVDEGGHDLGERTFTSRLDYISIPLLVKYSREWDEVSAYLLAGPRFDIFLGYADGDGDLVYGIEDEYKDFVFGLSGGFGIERRILSLQTIFVEFVYNYDPLWLYESTNIMTGNAFKVKNQSFNISIGIRL